MNYLKTTILFMLLTIASTIFAQTKPIEDEENSERIEISHALAGELTCYNIIPINSFIRPTETDSIEAGVIYPLIAINGIVIRDSTMLEYLNTHLDRKKITFETASQRMCVEVAMKLKARNPSLRMNKVIDITNVPLDGVLFIKTEKGYYFDFESENNEEDIFISNQDRNPLLVINNVIIRDKEDVDFFRSQIDFSEIKGSKHLSKAKAEKKALKMFLRKELCL